MKTIRILLTVLCTASWLPTRLVAMATSMPPLSLSNDGLNFYATIVAAQGGTSLVWDGGRNGVSAGGSVFVEARSPSWLKSLDLNTSLMGDDLLLNWSFSGFFGSPPTFPVMMQQGTVTIGDIDWRDSSGNIVERGAVSVQILNGNWEVTSLAGTGVGFTYTGPATISSLNDLAFSARLFNSVTVPEPSSISLVAVGIVVCICWRRRMSSSSRA